MLQNTKCFKILNVTKWPYQSRRNHMREFLYCPSYKFTDMTLVHSHNVVIVVKFVVEVQI